MSEPVTPFHGSAVPLFKYKRLRPAALPATKSRSPSPSTSPSTTEKVRCPSVVMSDPAPKLPLPSFRYRRLVPQSFPATRSRSPSPSHVAQDDGVGGVRVGRDARARHAVPRVGCAVVQVQTVRLVQVPRHKIQIPVAVHVAQDDRPRGMSRARSMPVPAPKLPVTPFQI